MSDMDELIKLKQNDALIDVAIGTQGA